MFKKSQLFFYSLFFFIDKKVTFYISFVHERFLRVITIQDFWIVRVATQICDINFVFEGRIFYSLSFGSSRETVTSQRFRYLVIPLFVDWSVLFATIRTITLI